MPVLPVKSSPILVTLAVLLAACGGSDSAASNPPAADAVATEAAPPADASMPASAGVAAVPLTGPLVADLSLPFGHHVLLDRTDDVGPVSQRTLTLETVDTPFADALAAITQALTAAGFSTTDDQTLDDTRILGFTKGSPMQPGGYSVRLQGSAYGPGTTGAATGATGQLSVTVRSGK
jgi:hypothetical protein